MKPKKQTKNWMKIAHRTCSRTTKLCISNELYMEIAIILIGVNSGKITESLKSILFQNIS